MHANFSTCGAEGWLAPTGACAAPAWARWAYFEPWVATIAFFVWIALYKTLECGGDVRAAIKAQVDGDGWIVKALYKEQEDWDALLTNPAYDELRRGRTIEQLESAMATWMCYGNMSKR